jgi:phosphoglycerate dehydrogenase-like enzyme
MLDWDRMSRPNLVVCAGEALFESFFPPAARKQLSRKFRWQRDDSGSMVPVLRAKLAAAEALITTWDSPQFSPNLTSRAPHLRMIAHCGGEVKSRFAPQLFDQLTITNAPAPMARATAELGAAFLLCSARNVDFYRQQLRGRSNRIYEDLHLHGSSESLIGREVSMIGFGRIGQALVEMMRGFDLKWLVYDPYAPKALAQRYPVRFVSLPTVLKRAHLLVLTAALTQETRELLNPARLSQLPDGAVVINIARGGLVDLPSLTREVQRGRLRCAIDVTDPLEPLPVGHPLRRLPAAIVTPHIAGSNRHVREEIAQVVLDDLERFFSGRNVNNRVTAAMLDRMT